MCEDLDQSQALPRQGKLDASPSTVRLRRREVFIGEPLRWTLGHMATVLFMFKMMPILSIHLVCLTGSQSDLMYSDLSRTQARCATAYAMDAGS